MTTKTLLAALLVSFVSAYGPPASAAEKNAEDICPALIGEEVPHATLRTAAGDEVNLQEVIAGQPTVIIFYRGGWCPYCNTHLSDLRNIEAELQSLGFQILAISPDRPEELQKTRVDQEVGYQLLSDSDMEAAEAFGLAFEVSQATYRKYIGFGINLEKSSGRDHRQLPVPAAFVVDAQGTITFTYVNPNYKVRVSGDLLLAAAREAIASE
jgi:peroxiredoxin